MDELSVVGEYASVALFCAGVPRKNKTARFLAPRKAMFDGVAPTSSPIQVAFAARSLVSSPLQRPTALDQVDHDGNDGEDQQNVDETAERVRRNEPQ